MADPTVAQGPQVTVVQSTNRLTRAREYRVVALVDGDHRTVAGAPIPFGIKREAELVAEGWTTYLGWRA